jgi:hypothetical protein
MLPTGPAEIGYLAGLFDGEGSLSRLKASGHWVVQIAMTHEPTMQYLGSLGGTLRPRGVLGNRKPCWGWRVMASNEVIEFLRLVLPYLRVKRQLALDALDELTA